MTLNTKLDNILIPRAEAVSIRVGLFKNQHLIAWAEPISADEQTRYRGFDNATFYRLEPLSFPFAAGDILESAAVLTDEYGREVICPDWFPLTLDSAGPSLVFPRQHRVRIPLTLTASIRTFPTGHSNKPKSQPVGAGF